MNQDANQNASSAPLSSAPGQSADGSITVPVPDAGARVPAPTSPPEAARSTMKSTLKVVVPLVALVGVVFGITYITMYTPPKEDTDKDKNTSKRGSKKNEPPLVFFSSTRGWDPPRLAGKYRDLPMLAPSALEPPTDDPMKFNFTLQNRLFQGIYEIDPDTRRRTQFWFENRNAEPVTMQLQGVSCMACTGGNVAAIPPEVTRNLFQHTALSMLPLGPFNGLSLGLVQPAASLSQLQWTRYEFKDHPHATYHIPAGTSDPWAPQWGILELAFKVQGERKEPLRAAFATKVDGTTRESINQFAIMFLVSPECLLSRTTIDVGKLDPLSGNRDYDFLVYSATRGPGAEFGELPVPSCIVQAPGGGDTVEFLQVSKPRRIPDADLVDIANELKTRVRSAYKITVTVRPNVGEKRMDIGLFERTLSVTAGAVTQQVVVRAMVSGGVWLEGDRTEIDLGDFRGKVGLRRSSADLITEKDNLELVLVKDECRPAKFTYELEKQPARGGRGHYKLLISIPSGQFGKVRGEAVLEVKGPTPQRMRIPVIGSGSF